MGRRMLKVEGVEGGGEGWGDRYVQLTGRRSRIFGDATMRGFLKFLTICGGKVNKLLV